MNKERRKRIKEAKELLIKATDLLESYNKIIEDVNLEESIAFDNMPESFQEGDRGLDMQEAMESMDEVVEEIEEIIDKLNHLQTGLDDI